MDSFLSNSKKPFHASRAFASEPPQTNIPLFEDDNASTDIKLAILASLHPGVDQETLLDLLIAAEGSIEEASKSLSSSREAASPTKKRPAAGVGYQTSLSAFRKTGNVSRVASPAKRRALTRKGQTLHLYTPEDIVDHTPCSIIHNFLPGQEANALLRELLEEADTFERQTFKLFDNVVESPHSACFYVDSLEEMTRQKTEYLYNGSFLTVYLLHCSMPIEIMLIPSRMCGKLSRKCAWSRPKCRLL